LRTVGEGKPVTVRATLEPTAGPRPAAETEAEALRSLPFSVGGTAFTAFFDWFGFGARNVDAMMKSRTILVRGVRALNNASFGVALMSVEHAAAAARGISNCRTLADWIDVQNCIVKLGVGRMIGTTCKLSNMAVQVSEDASVPLTRRVGASFDEIAEKSVA
jgi:hypothetical protein